MGNKMKYRPDLSYVLNKIKTVNNISEHSLQEAESRLKRSCSKALNDLEENIDRLDALRRKIDETLSGTEIKLNHSLSDQIPAFLIESHPDRTKFQEHDIITYSLYLFAQKEEFLYPIVHEWDIYHAGIHGMIEAEIQPSVLQFKEDHQMAREVILQTGLYDKEQKSREEMAEEELMEAIHTLEEENALKKKELDPSTDYAVIEKMRRKLDERKRKQELVENFNTSAIRFAKKADKAIQKMEFMLDKKEERNKEAALKAQQTLERSKNLDRDKLSFLLYHNFTNVQKETTAAKKESEGILDPKAREARKKEAIMLNRMQMEIVMPSLSEIEFLEEEGDDEALMMILDGAEDITHRQQMAGLEFKNSLEVSARYHAQQTTALAYKDKVRVLHKNMK